jgi:hypothetical protein
MKKLLLLLVSILTMMLTACSSDDSNNNSTPNTPYIKFKADGVDHNYNPETLTSLQKLIRASVGEGDTYKEISLWMPVTPTVGTHDIVYNSGSDVDTYSAIYASSFDNRYDAESGTLTITSIDDEYIRGTFSFTIDNDGTPIVITEGEFLAYN